MTSRLRPQVREAAPAERAAGGPIEHQRPAGLRRLWLALRNSLRGFVGAFREEAAFRQEVALSIVVIPAGLWLGQTGVEKVLLIAPMILVMIVELLNSAVETAIDRIGVEHHALSGLAKDIGSAAVLASFVLLIVVWVLVLFY
jgi:diacylglycerol kinase (ATP)